MVFVLFLYIRMLDLSLDYGFQNCVCVYFFLLFTSFPLQVVSTIFFSQNFMQQISLGFLLMSRKKNYYLKKTIILLTTSHSMYRGYFSLLHFSICFVFRCFSYNFNQLNLNSVSNCCANQFHINGCVVFEKENIVCPKH